MQTFTAAPWLRARAAIVGDLAERRQRRGRCEIRKPRDQLVMACDDPVASAGDAGCNYATKDSWRSACVATRSRPWFLAIRAIGPSYFGINDPD
jgi:hypothetical protein